MKNKDIAIVGMSCFAPGANDIHQYWNNLIHGVDSITDAPPDRIDPRYFEGENAIDRFYCKKGGFAPEFIFNPLPYSILPLAVEGMDTVHLLAIKLVYKALEDAAVFEKNISLKNAALIIGKGNYVGSAIWRAIDIVHVGEQIAEVVKTALPSLTQEEVTKIKREYQTSRGRYQADSMPGLIPNLIASLISNKLDMHGPAYTIDAACASSLIAVEHCVNEIVSGRCDIAIAGGVHASQNATFWSIFTQLGALSHKQKIAPFSEDADGLLIGEGGGFVVLKSLEKALADKDRIYAVIKGVGVSSDGSGVSVMAPAAKGQELAIKEAWKKSGMNPSRLGYIEAHGTATVVGDKAELSSLSTVFPNEEGANKILIGSVKSNIGHAMPAAGAFGLIKTALALYHKKIPATLHCEKPLKEMEKSRFRPVQKLEIWDESKYPLVAGVNAFGFGGINAHVILEAYQSNEKSESLVSPFRDQVLALSAPTKEALIDALRGKNHSITAHTEGNYRLILFDPTPDRIEKAIKLIEKDVIWKGRQDIWFSNEPLLKNGGKVAFMYPGFDPSSDPETDSLSDYFQLDIPEEKIDRDHLLINHTLKLYRSNEVMNASLNQLGITSDLNLGHSMGEWLGMRASGMLSEDSEKQMIKSIDPDEYHVNELYFIAAGCKKEQLMPIIDQIPNTYLSNDNCPNQLLVCCKGNDTINKLIPELQKEQIFFQQLSFQSGFHSPFIKDKMHLLEEAFQVLEFSGYNTPMWSANSLSPYPQTQQEIKELSVKHLLETVRFRELIEKLYEKENVRVFVQVGTGSLVGFVDDTLTTRKYGAVSTTSNSRSTLEQFRRVLALLYIEGKSIDLNFLNADNKASSQENPEKGMRFPMGMHLALQFPLLSKLSEKNKAFSSIDMATLSIDTGNPVLTALNQNMKDMIQMQTELSDLFRSKGSSVRPNISVSMQQPVPAPAAVPVQAVLQNQKKEGQSFDEELYVSLETHPTIIDHSLVKQPPSWKYLEDLNPVIPMTMTVELMGEVANRQDPSKKVAKIGPISVFQWMEVHNPFKQTIHGVWKSEDTVSLGIKGFVSADVTLKDSFSTPDPFFAGDIDLGKDIRKFPSKPEIYESYMFHGPAYQGIEKVTNLTEKGIRTILKKQAGKGSLLDNVGQTFGLYLHMTLEKNFISFPVKIQEINFYQDMHDQDGEFECICLTKEINESFVISDIVLRRDGKVWCIIKGWQNRRFEFDDLVWQMMLKPRKNMVAHEIAPGVFYYFNAYEKSHSWNFLYRRYLNQPEKKHYFSLLPNMQKNYLISRIALKDSLRAYVQNKFDKTSYPIEYFIQYDPNHKPSVYGIDETKGLEISIAHKGSDAVSIVSDKPVGIDIETIEERTNGFIELSYTEHEQSLLKGRDQAEWTTRFWVAKEAYSKMTGTGLRGNPKRYEVKSIIDDNHLMIEDCEVEMMKFKNFIIGWTK